MFLSVAALSLVCPTTRGFRSLWFLFLFFLSAENAWFPLFHSCLTTSICSWPRRTISVPLNFSSSGDIPISLACQFHYSRQARSLFPLPSSLLFPLLSSPDCRPALFLVLFGPSQRRNANASSYVNHTSSMFLVFLPPPPPPPHPPPPPPHTEFPLFEHFITEGLMVETEFSYYLSSFSPSFSDISK